MKIAICDDQKETLEELKKMLGRIPYIKKIHLYSDMEIFLAALKEENPYDAVLMDLNWMNEKTGIDLAEEVQRCSPLTKIVYVTAYTMEYVEDIFLKTPNVNGFLTKPVKMEQLEKTMTKIQKEQKKPEGKLVIRSNGSMIAIPFQNIIFIENQLHKVRIVLAEKEYYCYEKLERLRERLNEQFLACHKSYIVNMEQILEFQNSEIQMTHGKIVPVSKARRKEAKDRFFTYMSDKL